MKKTLFLLILIAASFAGYSQDSTQVRSFKLPAKLLFHLNPLMIKADNDSLFQVAVDLRTKLRGNAALTEAIVVTIDSIPTTELSNFYNYCLNAPSYTGLLPLMKSSLTSARSTNAYLDRMCKNLEDFYDDKIKENIQTGRRMITGKK